MIRGGRRSAPVWGMFHMHADALKFAARHARASGVRLRVRASGAFWAVEEVRP